MEKHLLKPSPRADSLALFVIFYPIISWLTYAIPALDGTWELVLIVPMIVLSMKAVLIPGGSTTQESFKPTKRSSSSGGSSGGNSFRHRTPPFWGFIVRFYLWLRGESLAYKESMHSRTPSAISHPPRIKYVGPTYVGFVLQHLEPSWLRYYVNDIPWTQVYVCDEEKTAVVFGLSENTIYNVTVKYTEKESEKQTFLICTLGCNPSTLSTSSVSNTSTSLSSSSSSSFSASMPFPASSNLSTPASHSASSHNASSHSAASHITTHNNSSSTNTNEDGGAGNNANKPRRRNVDVHGEGLSSIRLLLDEEKARARKLKKDGLKRLNSLRHEIDSVNTKLSTKHKADERSRKRIQVLKDRVSQQKAELAELQERVSVSSASSTDVAQLASEVEAMQRERHSKQQGLEVNIRVWSELQRTKQNEVDKLKQRCAKLCDRVERLHNDAAGHDAAKAKLVSDLVQQLREERSSRKQRRVRLEADFRTAIAKLDSGIHSN